MYKKIYRNMCFLAIVTLILSSVLVLCACYTSFNNKQKEEIKNEALLLADILNTGENPAEAMKNAKNATDKKQIVIISPSGEVIYSNSHETNYPENMNSEPEVAKARAENSGDDERYSKKDRTKMFYCAVKLKGNYVLRIAAKSSYAFSILYSVLLSVLFMMALIYILTAIIASRLTENIIKPIENIHSFDSSELENVYEEIQPFVRRILNQNNEIKRQLSKIQSQKARLQAIMDNINEGLVIVDKNTDIISVNKCAADIFGSEEKEMKYKNISALTERPEIHSALKKALCGSKGNIIFDANDRVYQIFLSPLCDKDEINGAVMLLFDVSEKNQSEKIRREFTANVSHELKTPLTTIHGYAQIIDSGIARPDDVFGFVKKIEKESSRLIALVDDIIKLSHIDEAESDGQKQKISLKSVVSEVAENLASKAAEADVEVKISGNDSTVFASLSQITEMLYNLVDNAIKYNRRGGSVDITVSENQVVISDTGIGIPEKYYDRIFERFFRVDKSHSKKVNGTGLGLSIVKHLAKANNTTIEVSSRLNEGSTFTVKFNCA